MSSASEVMKGMAPPQQEAAKQMLGPGGAQGLDDQVKKIFADLEIGELGKSLLLTVITFVRRHILPKLPQDNALLNFAVSSVLDAIENALR